MTFFPLRAGARWEYAVEDSEGRSDLVVEVLSVETRGPAVVARVRRTSRGGTADYEARVDPREVRGDGRLEFPVPPTVGAEWSSGSRSFRVESLHAAVETPAGRFSGCLRVSWLIAGGDGGSGERFYAPGVGLVCEVERDEAEPWSRLLRRAS